ncbi:uncharacterized protein BO95DRAFT_199775 [Aspergillus brunneoviolaceus CBS 621.78]|uniref:Uncharacterized protein n=1 Tax=Aspergillus brunneoviolaceus CBS 621.78 TaxID=1450534 RepID=A0ACD1G3W1_9EURO|nr:hypothetical protein BO95DRAFT_199775 [Aspergillus brunneoviolaceus CBS 621.78]RAH43831.1 hypothetical protein BO95DRAFT_199775 [Aspergillus brunneoviolaceus CBS 621.78]
MCGGTVTIMDGVSAEFFSTPSQSSANINPIHLCKSSARLLESRCKNPSPQRREVEETNIMASNSSKAHANYRSMRGLVMAAQGPSFSQLCELGRTVSLPSRSSSASSLPCSPVTPCHFFFSSRCGCPPTGDQGCAGWFPHRHETLGGVRFFSRLAVGTRGMFSASICSFHRSGGAAGSLSPVRPFSSTRPEPVFET